MSFQNNKINPPIDQQIQQQMMSLQPKRRIQKEIHGNQNYLNFIKKNHLTIQDEFNDHLSPKANSVKKQYQSNSSGNCPFRRKDAIRQQGQQQVQTSRVIHDSLSKFQFGSQEVNQMKQMYTIERKDGVFINHNNSTIYDQIQKRNNQIAQNLLQNRTKHARHEAAKELLFHLNKNRSPDHKKHQFKSITVDRYNTIQELNLKFPVIERKSHVSLAHDGESQKGKRELVERLRLIENQEKIKDRFQKTEPKQRQMLIIEKQVQQKMNPEQLKKLEKTRHLEHKFKIRQQLYGLLPSFKGPTIHHEILKKNKNQNSQKYKIKVQKNTKLRQSLDQYLQKNILVKCSSISVHKQKNKERDFNAIINRDILDSTMLDNKEEMDLDYPDYPSPSIRRPNSEIQKYSEPIAENESTFEPVSTKQIDIKPKPKKPVAGLKYEGDLSVYELKIRYYRQFLFMINMAHRVFDPVILKDLGSFKPESRYKFYLGKGNNYLLIKSLLKRRFWWTVEQDPKKANFVWTQLKVNYFYQLQKRAEPHRINHKLDKDFENSAQSPKKKKKKAQAQTKQPIKAGIYRAPLPANDKKIFTKADKHYYDQFLQRAQNPEKLLKFPNRLKYFEQDFFKTRQEDNYGEKVHNHFEFNYFIGNKKALFYSLKQYYDLLNKNVFSIIPLTYHIKKGTVDPQYEIFIREYKKAARDKSKNNAKNVWIVKPGELSNRGQGITVIDQIYELNNILRKKQKHFNGIEKTYIIQKYIQRPLLYRGRKFDLRHFMMISRQHGVMRAYWFGQGYIRTSSYQFNIEDIGDQMVHLTNDAIQKYSNGYGKYEEGNKVSYNQFQRYMQSMTGQGKFNFNDMIYQKMKSIALDTVKATYLQMDPNNTEHNFQIFGLDFMIDVNYDVWLIQVNTNPCLELSSKLLSRVIPTMLEQSFRLALDPLFPPPAHYPNSQKYLAPDNPLERLQYQLIFDQARDGKEIQSLFMNVKAVDMGEVDEQDETYQNDGNEIELDNELD